MTSQSDGWTKKSRFFATVFLATFPVECAAFDWGDFHVFAVVFFSFLGGFIGLGAIFGAIYVACLKPFLNRFQEEVAETHREHHPWPPGSVRWRLQQIMKTERSRTAADETKFPTQGFSASYADPRGGASGAYYPTFYAPPPPHHSYDYYAAQLAAVGGGGGGGGGVGGGAASSLGGPFYATDRDLIIGGDYTMHVQEQQRPRPTYFTPTPEKSLGPLREEIEEYRIIREESFVSSKSGGDGGRSAAAAPPPEIPPRLHHRAPNNDVKLIRTTMTTTTSSTRRRSPSRHAVTAGREISGTSVYGGSESAAAAEPNAVRVGEAPAGAQPPPPPPPSTHPPSNI